MLRDVTTRDVPWLIDGLTCWQRTRRWSRRGTSPSPVHVERLLSDPARARAAVWREDRPLAVLEVVDDNPRHGTAELAFMVDPARAADLAPDAAAFLGGVFARHPDLRKLSVWACDDEVDVPLALGDRARLCGRLVAHERRGPDEHVDVVVFEVWPEGDR
jgi:hypothetical protein